MRSLLSMRRLSREYRTAGWDKCGCITNTAGEIIETRQVDWCDQKHTVEGQTGLYGRQIGLRVYHERYKAERGPKE